MFYRKLFSKTVPNLSFSHRSSSCSLTRTFSDKSSQNDFPEGSEASDVSKLLDDATTFSDAQDPNWAKNPYPDTAPVNQQKEPEPLKVLPTDNSIILFPGQGVLKVGMIKNYMRFPRAKELYSIASEILNYDLAKLCLEGPQTQLNKTEFNQPATVVASLAALEQLSEERPRVLETCRAVAGYSVGELTALIFSGAIDYESGIKLVKTRALAMSNAAELSKQGMLYAYVKPEARIFQICKDAESWARDLGVSEAVCRVAIYLCTQTKIIGGNKEALQYIQENSAKLGLKNVKRLPVSGAFHTPLMEPAIEPFKTLLFNTEIQEPIVNVYSNVTANSHRGYIDIKKNLIKQLIYPVRWEQTLQKLYTRPPGSPFPRTFDLASGGQLKSTLKLVNSKAWDWCYTV